MEGFVSERMLVNKRELAVILGCSLPTLDKMIRQHRNFPTVRRGSPGVDWGFEAETVIEFIRQKREEARHDAERALEEKAAYLDQFALPIDDLVPESERGLSPNQRAALARARLAERKLAMESGMLVPVAELRQGLTAVWSHLGKRFDDLPRLLGTECDLSPETQERMRSYLDSWRRLTVTALSDLFPKEHSPAPEPPNPLSEDAA